MGQAAQPVILIVNGDSVGSTNPLPTTSSGAMTDLSQAAQPVVVIVNGLPVSGANPLPVTGGGGSINTQSGASYSLQISDNGSIVYFTNGSAIALTVPSGLGVAFECGIVQGGAGQVTITGSGATISNRQSFTKTAGQYALVSLIAVVADTFILAGDGA